MKVVEQGRQERHVMPTLLKAALGVLLVVSAAGSSAQMYSWKDAKGVSHFSDQPPPDQPPARDQGAAVSNPAPSASQPSLPYALNEAVRRHPVVLYTTSGCGPCEQGRALLQQRGIPFTEKTVQSNEDQQRLQAAGSDARLPLLLVGSNKQIGFEAIAWQEALTAAAYPLQSRLPAGWRPGPALAAAPVPVAKAEAVVSPTVTPQKPPPANAPPGFQF
ncbi:glutaredoxin family protein [Massilia sp. PWRC2]|uniref:glutaredoxin family protein n=1 Tax=Massilia sp. PWRC2 TaxID=2804626 RepID=UPI003CFAA4B4